MTLAREFVRAVREDSEAPLREDVALAARLHFLDAGGVGLASAGSPVGAAYCDFSRGVVRPGLWRHVRRRCADQRRIDDVYGNHTRPPGADPIMTKFRANAARSLQPAAIASVERAAEGLMAARDLGALSRALRQVKIADKQRDRSASS